MKLSSYLSYYMEERVVWREKEKARIGGVQMDKFRGLLGTGIKCRKLNAWIRELCQFMEGVDERFDKGLAIVKEWRIIGLLKRYVGESL